MRRYLGSIPLAAACLVAFSTSATLHGDDLGSSVNRQLAAARAATAIYHDADAAIADQYVNVGSNPSEGEAVEFVNFGLVMNCTLDALHPEALRYVASGGRLRLVAVEYSIPKACGDPPENFLPGAGEWEDEMIAPAWSKAVWIWSGQLQQHETE
jgi:hypothetical protein